MTCHFNLIDEPWIPCQSVDGRSEFLGLSETFRRATEIRRIYDSSPLVTIALHRLLLAILYRTQAPEKPADWRSMQTGGWNQELIDQYLQERHDWFDLFSEDHPFMQLQGFIAKEPTPISKLAEEMAAGNNATLFDHSMDDKPVAVSPAVAAQRLVAAQCFALGSGGGYKQASGVSGTLTLVMRDTLAATLAANCAPKSILAHGPFSLGTSASKDLPAWERSDASRFGGARVPDGPADLYAWSSRKVRLLPLTAPDGTTTIKTIYYGPGGELKWDFRDPMKNWILLPNRGWVSISLKENRCLWHESYSLFNTFEFGNTNAQLCPAAALLAARDSDGVSTLCIVFGMLTKTGGGGVALWRQEHFALPVRLLQDEDVPAQIKQAISMADDVACIIRDNVLKFATEYLKGEDGRNCDKKGAERMAKAVTRESDFWASLETPFHSFLSSLGGEKPHFRDWQSTLRRQAVSAFEASVSGREQTARSLRAAVRARNKFDAQLNEILPKEDNNEPTNQGAT